MISSARTPPRDGLSALLAFVPRVFRAKWIGLVAGVLGLAGTAVGVLLTQRLYRSETVLLYEKGLAGGEESSRGLGIRLQDSFSSRVRLEGLIKKNNLYPRLVKKRGLVEAADEMNAHVKVIIREGYAYRVSYDTDDRDRAQQVLTQLVQSVIDEETERRRRQADETKSFLDAERARADADVKVKESALGNFLSRHPQLAGVSGSAPGATIRAAESGAGPADTFGLEMQAANIEDAIAKAKMGGQPGQPVMKGGRMLDPTLVAAQSKAAADLQAARRDLVAKEARFTNDHPDVKAAVTAANQAERAYRQAEAAAAASATTGSSAPSGDAPAADGSASGAGQAASLQRALAAVRAQIGAVRARSAPRREVERDLKTSVAVDTEWAELARAATEARERQQQLEARQFQAQLTATLVAANQAGGLQVIDPPFRPMKPITGGRSKVAIGGGLGSLILALGVMLLAAKFDRRIYGVEDIARVYPVDILVEVPRLEAVKSE